MGTIKVVHCLRPGHFPKTPGTITTGIHSGRSILPRVSTLNIIKEEFSKLFVKELPVMTETCTGITSVRRLMKTVPSKGPMHLHMSILLECITIMKRSLIFIPMWKKGLYR